VRSIRPSSEIQSHCAVRCKACAGLRMRTPNVEPTGGNPSTRCARFWRGFVVAEWRAKEAESGA
jgi:hypothetical protein